MYIFNPVIISIIKKRRPKPFRYLKREEVLQDNDITFDEENSFSIMKTGKTKITNNDKDQVVLCNNKNLGKIEDIIKKHSEIRKI